MVFLNFPVFRKGGFFKPRNLPFFLVGRRFSAWFRFFGKGGFGIRGTGLFRPSSLGPLAPPVYVRVYGRLYGPVGGAPVRGSGLQPGPVLLEPGADVGGPAEGSTLCF